MSDALLDLQLPSNIQATAQLDELKAASLSFLGNVQARFGEHSSQLCNVHETLGAFKRRELSKRDAHTTILNTLEGHDDLRQELMDVLIHPAAKWAPGDFDLPEQPTEPFLEPAPQFLQPAHQPQMRLPFISSSWFTIPQVDQSAGLGMFNGYNGHNPMASFPSPPGLAPSQLPSPPTHLWMDHSANAMYAAVNDDASVPPSIHTAFRNPWQDGSYADAWTNNDMDFPPDGAYVDEHFEPQYSPGVPYSDHFQPSVVYPQDTGPYQRPTPLQQHVLPPVHTPQLTHALLPSSVDDNAFRETSLEEERLINIEVPPTPFSQLPPYAQQRQDVENSGHDTTTDRDRSLGGPFIHALCGKGFATLSGVKKHHWGKKVNDLATMTGCWAKHKRPDIAWDDHPSCKDGRSTSETIKSVPLASKPGQPKASIAQPKAPIALDAPQFNTLPGFPTLDDLPRTVAKTLGAGNASIYSPEERESHYHAHRLPSRSSFDNLLLAVNVVSQIDAPKPQARTDSIALHLDAQVAAAEQHTPSVPYMPPTSTSDLQYVRPVVPTALDTTSPGMGELTPHDMSGGFRNYEDEEQPSVISSDVEESYAAAAFLRPFKPIGAQSSGPARKKRKI